MSDLLDPLWASTLDTIQIDLLEHNVTIEAHVNDCGKTTRYRLACQGVADLRLVDPQPRGPWDYVEISEADMRETSDGGFEVRLELWVPEVELFVTAADVQLHRSDATTR